MEIIVKEVEVNDYLTKSNLPASDYVINPYIGCPHGCKYCYASFMKRFTHHEEPWGKFIDIKKCDKKINVERLKGKSVFLSSVTDCYNKFEEEYKITRGILESLVDADCELTISTKSSLILRDIDLLKKMKNLKVAISINTLDEKFRSDMDNASSIEDRLDTLKTLHNNGIYTCLFMSPIFPYITDFKSIIENSREFIDEYWFENLNLRGSYKSTIMSYIRENYPELIDKYHDIYTRNNENYWKNLSDEIDEYCKSNNIKYINYFYHDKLVEKKQENIQKQSGNKVALVTGGTSGIGKSIVENLLKKGYKVATCYSKNDTLAEKLKSDLKNDNLYVYKCDIRNEVQVINMFNKITRDLGNIDYLVNNAGTFIDSYIKDFDMADFKEVLDINFIGKVICTKHAYNMMNDGGSIVNIASHLGVMPCTESAAYCAAAAAIINFTKASALEYADKHIRVNSICPAFTPTPLSIRGWTKEEIDEKLKNTPLGRLATPEDTAKLCLFLLSDEASFITGENISINGGRL